MEEYETTGSEKNAFKGSGVWINRIIISYVLLEQAASADTNRNRKTNTNTSTSPNTNTNTPSRRLVPRWPTAVWEAEPGY